MTPKERATLALQRKIPDQVPTFELEFQLEEEMFGRKFITPDLSSGELKKASQKERERRIYGLAEYMAEVYTALEYSIIPSYGEWSWNPQWNEGIVGEYTLLLIRYLNELMGDRALLGYHGDGTFGIPDGKSMYEFAYRTDDDPEGLMAEAELGAEMAIKRNRQLREAGISVSLLCSDYCYNSGPFLSPEMFSQFIQPYLAKIIAANRSAGLFSIKHTDGNIMPIIDQMVDAEPDALHSIDPMAGVDIREVKEKYGDRICLVGNVHCAALQTGTDEEVRESAEYCMTWAKPGGGYIFSTSNVPFKGMPPERYRMILDIWKEMRAY